MGSTGSMGNSGAENPRAASTRAAEAAARVAARYAKAPSYSELLAGEARAVVRAAGAAAEAARDAQAAAQAVLAGLESGPVASGLWEPAVRHSGPVLDENAENENALHEDTAPARWQDEPPAVVVASPNPVRQESTASVGRESGWAGAQPRWEQALPVTAAAPASGRDVWSEMRLHPVHESGRESGQGPGRESGRELVDDHRRRYRSRAEDGEGELFPYDPVASATVEPVQHLPANLIEFPRELVATRKARPRLAEGPFYDASHENSQLSIFEVDPALLAPPVYLSDTRSGAVAPPEWASIELDELAELDHEVDHRRELELAAQEKSGPEYAESRHSGAVYDEHAYRERAFDYAAATEMMASTAEAMPVQAAPAPRADAFTNAVRESGSTRGGDSMPAVELLVASIGDRMLAAVVDGALVTLAFLAAAVVVIASTAHPPTGRIALIASGCGLLIFGLLYQFLFLSYAEEGTPGMRYARIALCTFDDDNPTSQQMQMRIPALLLAALPAGLGLLWAAFDRDHLGWHDRLTRTYQRKY